ncbi:hypothetical protein DPMN_147047 [Dreissena polymorpha]|uniref:Uncharacterized protein n=1 Tax=Dreissena polymorpha TaxID=45954 RepID=A0A9D4J2M4_DREPO|nr:hypothetical protein DPMN_147047 [Dreissena polymorpha]
MEMILETDGKARMMIILETGWGYNGDNSRDWRGATMLMTGKAEVVTIIEVVVVETDGEGRMEEKGNS